MSETSVVWPFGSSKTFEKSVMCKKFTVRMAEIRTDHLSDLCRKISRVLTGLIQIWPLKYGNGFEQSINSSPFFSDWTLWGSIYL